MSHPSALTDQVIVITGASSGIGAATARHLRAAGMRLVLTARREDRLRELAAELGETAFLAGDIADPELPGQLIGSALRAFGRCDAVFNNAGFMDAGPVDKIDIERVCHMVRVNVEAAYRLAYVAARHFLAQGHGHLINTSSILGTKVRAGAGAYAGTKWAVEALSEGLRMELAGTGVRVTVIEPGLVMTELHNHWEKHPADALGMKNPLQPGDIARAVQFVLEQPASVLVPRIMVVPSEQAL